MNGAFMLMGDGNFFRDVTGLNPEHFCRRGARVGISPPRS